MSGVVADMNCAASHVATAAALKHRAHHAQCAHAHVDSKLGKPSSRNSARELGSV